MSVVTLIIMNYERNTDTGNRTRVKAVKEPYPNH